MKKPNVLLITADQLRHDALSCYGNRVVKTPALDGLASMGVRFQNAYSPNPICVPARATITTGLYPHKCTENKNNGGRIVNGPRIAEVFNDAGYSSYAIGKLHYAPYAPPGEPRLLHGFQYCEICESGRMIKQFDPEGKARGIEDYHDYLHSVGWGGYERATAVGNNEVKGSVSALPPEHYVDSWVVTRSIAKLSEHLEKTDAPFLMWTSSPKPHSPYDPPRPFDALYDPREIPAPRGSHELLEGRDASLAAGRVRYAWELMSPQAVQVSRARYFGCVSFQDEQVGRLLDFLAEKRVLEDTIVVFTADHGDLLGDFGCFFKGNFLEGSVHVPFLIAGPGVPRGAVSDGLVGLQDILPTLTELCRIELEPVDGVGLCRHMKEGDSVREVYVSQCMGPPRRKYMAYDGRFKYIHCEAGGTEELYDLQDDPQELTNLVREGRELERARALKAQIVRFCREEDDASALDGDELRKSPAPEPPEGFRAASMGWRWY